MNRSRIAILVLSLGAAGAAGVAAAVSAQQPRAAEQAPRLIVYKSPT